MGRTLAWLLVAGTVFVGACSRDTLAVAPDVRECPTSLALSVSPHAIVRGAATDISVEWEASEALLSPVVTLGVGQANEVEVELPLHVGTRDGDYVGHLLNPFGVGAPGGAGRVLAVARAPSGCLTSPSATTTFELQ